MGKTKKHRCDRCHKAACEFDGPASGDGRPGFRCSACGHYWTAGKTGGKWADLIPKEETDA